MIDGEALLRRVMWRLVPFMCLLYLLAYLDRVNVGFAALQMSKDLGFSDAVFGLGAGIFFVGYFLFEVPSNLLLHRVGASRWIARIMISWGVLAVGLMFVRGAWSFYGVRLLLGMAEAGFFPGMVLYLSYWFPARYRARTGALFFTATAVAGLVGGPMSGALLSLDGWGGLRGWQWLFLVEGVPSILVGGFVFFYLTDRPAQAKWLTAEEAAWLTAEIEKDDTLGSAQEIAATKSAHQTLGTALADPKLWVLTTVYFTLTMGLYGVSFWMPKLLKGVTGYSDLGVGMLSAIPFAVATVAMVLVGRHSDRVGERRWHVALSAVLAAIGLAAAPFCTSTIGAVAAMSLATIGIWSAIGPFWAIPGDFLRGTAAAGGIAAINSVGNLGGFLGPYLVGFVRDRYQGFNGGLLVISACLVLGAALAVWGLGNAGGCAFQRVGAGEG